MKKGPSEAQQVKQLLAELERRTRFYELADKECFAKQLDFIKDPARRKALFVARRSGKTLTLAIYTLTQACIYPNRKFLYLGITQSSAVGAIWQHGFEHLLNKYHIPYTFNQTTKTITLANKSTIRLGGVDSSWRDMNKYLGTKQHMICIDEVQDITQDLQKLIDEKLAPAVADYVNKDGGILVLAGTAGEHMGDNYWFNITKTDSEGKAVNRLPGWSVHSWSVAENPAMVNEFGVVCADLINSKGADYQEDPGFQRQWLCRWVTLDSSIIYKYTAERNRLSLENESDRKVIVSLMSGGKEWTYIIGVDLGWEDATAFVVGAYRNTDRNFYIIESHKMDHTVLSTIGGFLVGLNAKYNPIRIIVDTGGGGKLAAESLREDYRLPIVAAEKTDAAAKVTNKRSAIARMNSDFICSQIKVVETPNKELIKEWAELIQDPKAKARGEFKEHDKFHNHLADAALYCFNDAQHHHSVVPVVPKAPDMADRILERRKRSENPYLQRDTYDRYEQDQQAKSIVAKYKGTK